MPMTSSGKLQQLAGHRLLEPVHARDAVADLDDAADLLQVDLRLVARQLALDDLADLSGLDHAVSPLPLRQALPHARELAVEAAVHDAGCRSRRRSRRADCLSSDLFDARPACRRARRARAGAASAVRSASVSGTAVRTRARTRPCAASSMPRYAVGDRAEVIGAPVRGDQRQEVGAELGQLAGARRPRLGDLLLDRGGHPRPAEHGGQLGVARDQLGHRARARPAIGSA